MDETFLIKQVQDGNTQAFRLLVTRYQRPLLKFLRGYYLDDGVTEELAQETFLRAFQHITRYHPTKGGSFVTWLFTIAKNLALNEQRKKKPSQTLPDETSACSSDHVETMQRQKQVRLAITQLKEPFRTTVILAYVKEFSLQQIAEIEQCPVGTVKSRLARGKTMLRALLVDETTP